MLANREYRYLSPVFTFDSRTRDALTIKGAALVHTPALRLTALASAEDRATSATEESEVLTALAGLPVVPATIDATALLAAVRDRLAGSGAIFEDMARAISFVLNDPLRLL